MDIIRIENLTKGFLSKKALNNVSLNLDKGKIYGLLGPNGSGKTTLMRILTGLLKPTHGNVYIHGHQIGKMTKKITSFMPTDKYIYPSMRIKTVRKYFEDMYTDFDPKKFDALLDFMDLEENMKVSSLSTGMEGRLKLILTLSRDSKLYLFDEPLNGIDFVSREKIINTIITEMNEEKTMVISSHLVAEMENLLDSAILIKDGQIATIVDTESLRENQSKSIVDLYREVFI